MSSGYDLLKRRTQAFGAWGAWSISYNTVDQILTETDADGIATSCVYNAAGRLVSRTTAGKTTTFSYDQAGRLVGRVDPDGKTLAKTYDPFGRLTEEKETVAGQDVRHVDYVVDSLARRTSALDTVSGVQKTWTYPLDQAAGVTETLRYDAASTTSTVVLRNDRHQETQRQTTFSPSQQVTFTIDARDTADRATRTTFAGSIVQEGSYDAADRVLRQWGSGFGAGAQNTDAYVYDPDTGKKTADALQLSLGGVVSGSYSYDPAGRLDQAVTAGGTQDYSYDELGNLVEVIDGSTTSTYAYDSVSRLVQSDAVNGSGTATTVYKWNAGNGWRTSQGPTVSSQPITFGYTGTGRLASYGDSTRGVASTYAYDTGGKRLKSVVAVGGVTTTTNFTYDDVTLLELNAARTDGASWKVSYLYDENDMPYAGIYRDPATSSAPVVFGIVTADRGDVVELLDRNGTPFATYRYDAWGNPVGGMADSWGRSTGITTQTTTLVSSPALAANIATRQMLRYAGYSYDAESYLYYCMARHYDSTTRQFLSKDPAEADGEESPYQYGSGDPVNNVDPLGLAIATVPGVRMQGQMKSNWCWAASLVCAVRAETTYEPGQPGTVDIVQPRKCKPGVNCGRHGNPQPASKHNWSMQSDADCERYKKRFQHFGIPAGYHFKSEYDHWFSKMKKRVEDEKPVVVRVYGSGAAAGHIMVLYGAGYNKSGNRRVKIMDPMPPNSEPSEGGTWRTMSWKTFKNNEGLGWGFAGVWTHYSK